MIKDGPGRVLSFADAFGVSFASSTQIVPWLEKNLERDAASTKKLKDLLQDDKDGKFMLGIQAKDEDRYFLVVESARMMERLGGDPELL